MLIDCHSMPSNPIADQGGARSGLRAWRPLRHLVQRRVDPLAAAQALKAQGYAVALNKPYAGGYITEHYGRPHAGAHALQIEINRALYMDETHLRQIVGI